MTQITSGIAAPVDRQIGLTIYATACASVVAVLLLTNWPGYQYAYRDGPIPLYYFVLSGIFIIPVLFAHPGAAVRFLKDPLLLWFVAYVLLGLVWLSMSQDFIEEASRQWRLRVWELFFFFTITILVSDAKRRYLAFVIMGVVLLMSAANWFDLMRPYHFVPQAEEGAVAGRGAGTFINPNAAAALVVMGTIAVLPFIPMRLRGALLVAAVLGVAATISRSGFILISVVIAAAVVLKLVNRAQVVFIAITLTALVAAYGIYYDTLLMSSNVSNLEQNIDRLRWFEGEEDDSSEERRYVAARTRDMFFESPVIGHGIGATGLSYSAGAHNMYVLLAAEQGIFGLALYLTLIGLMYRQGRRLAKSAETLEGRDVGNAMAVFGVFLAFYGVFSHNVLEEPHTAFTIAFLAAAALRSQPRAFMRQGVPAQAPARTRTRWRTTAPEGLNGARGRNAGQGQKDLPETT